MIGKWKKSGLVGLGIAAGLLLGLNFSAIAQRDARSPLPLPEIQALAEVFGNIKQGYVDAVDDKKLLTGAVKGMLTELDPHSSYLDPEENKEFETGIKGEFGGLGIEVGTEDGFIKVVSPIEDTPAFRAGIKANDLIVKIDDTSTKGITLNEAVKKMRGKPRTSIKLTVARKGETKPLEFTLVREVIKVQSVKAKVTEPGYAHLRITQFQEPTVADMARHLDRLYKESNGKLSGIVLDLRNNPGGLLHASIGVSAAFLEPKTLVVSSNGRLPDTKHDYLASPDEYAFRAREDVLRGLPASLKNVPMVVLVNDGSASASEIVAGALQDHKRAIIMGQQTFGKGSVQTKINLSNGAGMKLTTARYYTPLGRSIQAKGIVPDWLVHETAEGDKRPARSREADLAGHLTNDKDPNAEKAAVAKPEAKPEPAAKPEGSKDGDKGEDKPPVRLEYGSKEDFQYQQAINLLKGQPVKGEKSKDIPGAKTAETKK